MDILEVYLDQLRTSNQKKNQRKVKRKVKEEKVLAQAQSVYLQMPKEKMSQ